MVRLNESSPLWNQQNPLQLRNPPPSEPEPFSLDKLLWGDNFKSIYRKILRQGYDANIANAREALDAMTFPEAILILGEIESQIYEGKPYAVYEQISDMPILAYDKMPNSSRFLFKDEPINKNILWKFGGLIEAANPRYELISSDRRSLAYERI